MTYLVSEYLFHIFFFKYLAMDVLRSICINIKKNQIQITEMHIQTELYQLFNSNFNPYTKANKLI